MITSFHSGTFRVKNRLHEAFQQSNDFPSDAIDTLNPTHSRSIDVALHFVRNPVKMCEKIHELIQKLNAFVTNEHKSML